MTISILKSLIEAQGADDRLLNECRLILPELGTDARITPIEPSPQTVTKDLSGIYKARGAHLVSKAIPHGGVSVAADVFEKNLGLEVFVYQVETKHFGGYAFTNAMQNELLAFPYAESIEQ